MDREEAIKRLKGHIPELAERFGISALYLFGSVARNEARINSDIDILVDFKQPIGLFEFIELQQILEGLLECKVDLGTRRSLKNSLKNQVIQEAIRVV